MKKIVNLKVPQMAKNWLKYNFKNKSEDFS